MGERESEGSRRVAKAAWAPILSITVEGEEGGARGSRTGNPDRGFQVPLSPGTERPANCFIPRSFSFLDVEGKERAGLPPRSDGHPGLPQANITPVFTVSRR